MSLSPRSLSTDRIIGIVVLAIFAMGVLGAVAAVLLNHGVVPAQIANHAAQTAAPL
jgi:hypothetical protein